VKFLADENVSAEFIRLLRLLGWQVTTVHERKLAGVKDDARLIANAREHGEVLLCFDEFRRDQGPRVADEIYRRGGSYVRISGGPDQPVNRALGKLYFHLDEIEQRLTADEGGAVISDIKQSVRYTPRAKMVEYRRSVERRPPLGGYAQRQAAKHAAGGQKKPKKPVVPPEQGELLPD
jgi:hypothetical protein